jgi:diaminopimelate epimerase
VLIKSHGLGNDYLVADAAELPVELTPARARLLCDRHEGVGSDGVLLLEDAARRRLKIINPDGSAAEKSGNGLRIFAKWLFDTGRVRESHFSIETAGGVAPVEVEARDGRAHTISVGMGRPAFRTDLRELTVDGQRVPVVALSMGNPHCVVLRDQLDETEVRRLGPLIESHAAFPNRTNVQLARATGRQRVELLIWERGAGETRASGSSSCAVVAACHHLGLVDDRVTASMPGGELEVSIGPQGEITLRGPVAEVAEIRLSSELIERLQALP